MSKNYQEITGDISVYIAKCGMALAAMGDALRAFEESHHAA
jgi:hypothetical protein